ncbi:serine/threonine-protein kinase [Streptomyces niveus]|uniref:Serine/threonine protein kinase n=1 Tax=Streptomyces niveus TaxID=193462 RepID=A0A1U9QTF6_STRNV|nr:serine/threonine-protein kinase [Streptomyces niveus]AQU67457.1 serine/threonine protein kinase [Streptomyces niveus]
MNDVTDVFQPLQASDPAVVAGYRLAARLGAGGMGRVYLAHTQGGRPLAIKVVRPELADDPDFRRRFGREIRAAQRVRGAYTAELIDADADGVPPWLATLYVPGPSLSEAVARRGPLSVTALLWLMAGMAEALQAIHAEGIVHRDLKPSNVLLAADGPRVIDFGIALAADATSYTGTGQTVGTPAYMAPEQASAGAVTAATDVFALAQTAAFAALGRPLYGDGAGVDVLYRIVHSEPDLSLLPEPLRPLFARCLAADPAERATPAEVVEWCRQRLGPDADAGAGGGGAPAVWREISGPEVVVPPPVPDPTPALPQPLIGYSQPPAGFARLTQAQTQARVRRRRVARMMIVGSAVGALLLTVLAWRVLDAEGRDDRRDTTGSSASTEGPEGRSSDSARDSSSDSSESSDSSDSSGSGAPGAGEPTAGATSPSSASSQEPRPEPYPLIMLDAKNSVNLRDPDTEAKGRTGDIRFGCRSIGCELESDTSVFLQLYGKPGGTLDECRRLLKHGKNHHLPLAGAPNGSEICIKGPSGDIALFVISTKSTAMPDIAFLQGALTIWREAA